MSRTAMVVVAGLLAVGCVVAMLPAQESSRRTASKYRPGGSPPPSPTEPASDLLPIAAPPAELAPIVSPTGLMPPSTLSPGGAASGPMNLQQQLQASGQQIVNEYTPQPAVAPPSLVPPPGNSPFAPPADLSPLAPSPAPPPQTVVPPPAASAAAGETPADESQLRSVLKRSGPQLPAETAPATQPPPPTQAQPAVTPGLTASSRRAPQSSSPVAARSSAGGGSIQQLAVTARSPGLRVDVAGPQGITVGKPAAYVVNLANESDAPAEEVLLRLALPGWVKLTGSQPSHGEAGLEADAQGGARLFWNVPRVAARSQAQLRLALVTSQGDAFDLGVEWTCKPAAIRAAIVVKQPQLELSLAGPADMTFGEEKSFTLTVSNPGTGDAERVVVQMLSGSAPAQQVEVGSLPAGMKKELPLSVVASQAGEMELRATATGEGGLAAQTAGKIIVRKAEIQVAVQGPPLKFAGTEAIYTVTVANSGTAPADNVNVSLTLPSGAKYLGGIEGAAAAGGSPKWKLASLAAGAERTYEVRMQLVAAGLNRLVVQAQSAAGNVSAQAETDVQAVSDLKLVVNDPAGPLPVGEQAVYELQVMNRGSQAAQKVKIIMQFSDGIEPVSFEGCEARMVPGQILCQPLPQLGAGEQVTLRVRAKGQKPGTHQFRVEVTSTDGESRLVSEGTTRYFSETGRPAAAATTAQKPAEARPIQR